MSTVAEGKHYLAVMDGTGDTRSIWSPDNPDEVAAAKRTFTDLKKKGYIAYSVDEDGDKNEIMREFDPMAGKVIMHKPMVGG